MAFITNPRRDAHATIAGFFYQVNVTLLRWLSLQPSTHLQLECGEDIDTVEDGSSDGGSRERRLFEQLKIREGRALTLRSPEALEALSDFCAHRSSNPQMQLTFRYLTTARPGVEKGWKLPEGGIDTWMSLNKGGYDDDKRREALGEIREFLKTCKRPDHISEGGWHSLQLILADESDQALSDLVFSFEWAVGYGDANQSQADVLLALVAGGHAKSIDEAKSVFEHLFAFVFRLLSQRGPKLLTIDGLSTELLAPTIPPNQRGILLAIREELDEIRQDVSAVKATLAIQGKDG